MPPPGGAGGASVGFIKEKPDPWEVIIVISTFQMQWIETVRHNHFKTLHGFDKNCEVHFLLRQVMLQKTFK